MRDHRCRGRGLQPAPGTGDSDRGGDHPDPARPRAQTSRAATNRDPERFDAWLHRLVVNACYAEARTVTPARNPGHPSALRRLASSPRGGQSRMYYVSRGTIPPTRHTQHRAPDGSLYAEELFGVEGFTGRARCSTTWRRRRGPTDRAGPRVTSRPPTTAPPPPAHEDRRRPAEGRRRSPADPAVLQPRRRVRGRPAGGADARGPLLSQRRSRTRCCSSTRGPASAGRSSATSPTPGRLPGAADRHDVAAGPGPGLGAADPVPRGAVRDRAAQALPQRLRPAARALAVLAAGPPRPPSSASRSTSTATT